MTEGRGVGDLRTSLRWALALAATAAPTAVVLATYAAWRDRLPDQMATHWSGSPNGVPDGFSSPDTAAAWIAGTCVLALVLAVVLAVGVRVRGLSPRTAQAGIAFLASVAGVVAGSWLTVTTAALSAADPRQAHLGPRLLWGLGLLFLGVVPLLLLRGLPTPQRGGGAAGEQPGRHVPGRPARDQVVPQPLAPGQPTEWAQTLRSPMLIGVLAVVLAALVVIAVLASAWFWIAVVPLALALAAFAQLRVTVDERGLRLVSELLRLPIRRIPLVQITTASAEHIDPLQWGGWGYRVLPGRSALLLRTGPGLVLDLRDGRQFAVTLDDAETPARLLAGLLVRQ